MRGKGNSSIPTSLENLDPGRRERRCDGKRVRYGRGSNLLERAACLRKYLAVLSCTERVVVQSWIAIILPVE